MSRGLLIEDSSRPGRDACLVTYGLPRLLLGLNVGMCAQALIVRRQPRQMKQSGPLGLMRQSSRPRLRSLFRPPGMTMTWRRPSREEDETAVLGGDQFTPEQIAMAEATFTQQVSHEAGMNTGV